MPGYTESPHGSSKIVERIAIVGAGGTVGSHIVAELLRTGKHTVTAISREGSSNKLPRGVHVATINYDEEDTIVAALKGQQFLIITMAPAAPRDTHSKLVQAAAKAGVLYVMPNSYGSDIENIKLGQDTLLGPAAKASRDEIERLGMQWVAVCCGFWYDYSLAGGEARFGFDFDKQSLTIYDDGQTKFSTSTLAQVGRAVAKVLSLKERPSEKNDEILTLSSFLNKGVYLKSFVLSQKEIFESVKRVTGTSDADWTVTHESSKQRYEDGLAQVKEGNMTAFPKLLYARGLSSDAPSNLSVKAQNELLALPEENLDDATSSGVEMVKDLQRRPERMAS